jgi:hypothetical protein
MHSIIVLPSTDRTIITECMVCRDLITRYKLKIKIVFKYNKEGNHSATVGHKQWRI